MKNASIRKVTCPDTGGDFIPNEAHLNPCHFLWIVTSSLQRSHLMITPLKSKSARRLPSRPPTMTNPAKRTEILFESCCRGYDPRSDEHTCIHSLSKECAVKSPWGRGEWEMLWFRHRTHQRGRGVQIVEAVRGNKDGGVRWGWERGLRASAANVVMAQTRWVEEHWSKSRAETAMTLPQRHMSWQLVTTQPITPMQTQTHSYYPTHQIRPASLHITSTGVMNKSESTTIPCLKDHFCHSVIWCLRSLLLQYSSSTLTCSICFYNQ